MQGKYPDSLYLMRVRNEILDSVLVALSLVLIVVLPLSALRAVQIGHQSINYAHLALTITVWLVTWNRHRLRLRMKAAMLVGLSCVTAIVGLLTWGLIGQGGYYIIFAMAFASIMFQRRTVVVIGMSMLLAVAVIAYAVCFGDLTAHLDYASYGTGISSWLTFIGSLALLILATAAGLTRFHTVLLDAVDNLEQRVEERTQELETANRSLVLSDQVFRNTTEGIIITRANAEIVSVNPAFTQITGYSREEAIGENPRILQSGRQDAAFYLDFWNTLARDHQWRGEFWNKRKNGELYPQESSVTAVLDDNGEVLRYVAVFSDVTDRKLVEEKILHLATHDTLTGLPNRMLFGERLTVALKNAHRNKARVAVLFIDLDGFKQVNDDMGHDAGDAVLQEVAQRMVHTLRETDTVARMGGDEFAVLLVNVSETGGAAMVAEKILDTVSRPVLVKDREAEISACIGIALYPDHGKEVSELLNSADTAMYAVKNLGKGGFEYAN